MSTFNIAVIVGSLRRESINRKLAHAVIRLAPADFAFDVLDIGTLPLYNQDDDGNVAASVQTFKQGVRDASGLLFVTPEYNRSIPGVLKNAIDCGSRPYGTSAWAGKPAAVIGASPGASGTAMAQQHLRNVLAAVDVAVMPAPEVFLQIKDGFFDESGGIANASTLKFLEGWMGRYEAWIRRQTA